MKSTAYDVETENNSTSTNKMDIYLRGSSKISNSEEHSFGTLTGNRQTSISREIAIVHKTLTQFIVI